MTGNSGGINFNISSGNVKVDSVFQGNNNTLHQHNSGDQQVSLLESTLKGIEDAGVAQNASKNEIDELKNAIQILINKDSEKKDLGTTFKDLYDKFSWAIGPLQNLYKILVGV